MSYLRNFIVLGSVFLILNSGLLFSQEKEVREIEHEADETVYSQKFGKDVIRLIGHVVLKHEDLILTCDSAHLNQKSKILNGYSRVHIVKADTLELYGNKLFYDGIAKIVQLDDGVRMIQKNSVLKTAHLNYNMDEETAWYYGGGQIIDSLNVVESKWGYYYPDKEDYYLKEKVFWSNEDITLSTDTLYYSTKAESARFLGPTQIFGDTNYVYCEAGWYNSVENLSSFYQNALFQAGDQVMEGDSLIYDRENELFWAYGNVKATDTIQNSIIEGQKLFYDELIDRILVTEDALYTLIDSEDSLFLHADTLLSYRIDSIESRKIEGYHRVQFYRADIQGTCDSLDYLVKDSIIQLFNEPVLWQGNNQLTAKKIKVKMGNEGIEFIDLEEKGFLITELDSVHYNQIKGKIIKGYFVDNELSRVLVNGNGESIFFPEDDNGKIGMNKVLSSEMVMIFKDGKINRVVFITDPDSQLIPLNKASEAEKKLEGFQWLDKIRPISKEDLFIWKRKD